MSGSHTHMDMRVNTYISLAYTGAATHGPYAAALYEVIKARLHYVTFAKQRPLCHNYRMVAYW